MTIEKSQMREHNKFEELCALSMAGCLTESETAELKAHIELCEQCRAVSRDYSLLAKEGMPMLAASFDRPDEATGWSDSSLRRRVFERVAVAERRRTAPHREPPEIPMSSLQAGQRTSFRSVVRVSLAACLVVAVTLGAYKVGRMSESGRNRLDISVPVPDFALAAEKLAVENLLKAESQQVKQLEAESAKTQAEVEVLRKQLRVSEERATVVVAAKDTSDQQLQSAIAERNALHQKMEEARLEDQSIHTELAGLKTERDLATAKLVSVQRQLDDLVAENRDQRLRIGNEEQYLSEDRDIRELMGARQLYIADVFDVSSDSRTRKPYGRVFYTQGKSLIFYAFDLDRQRALKNASFQVWGKNESAQNKPVNLGILYMDSEKNRRWALRCDDPKQLEQIDAVFVTVEPEVHGNKPTGKPFLYASLRKQPNHP